MNSFFLFFLQFPRFLVEKRTGMIMILSLFMQRLFYFIYMVFLMSFISVLYPQDTLTPRIDSVVIAVQKTLPSVVNIGTERLITKPYSPWGEYDPFDAFFRDFFGEQITQKTTSLGSGVIIDPAGLILTNFHVIHRAAEINIVLYDGSSYKAIEIASDYINDLALIALYPAPKDKLKPIEIAPSGELYLGETVIAVGNPYGLGSSVSRGILSAVNRQATYMGKIIFSDILQTDTAINPGNSGGPLINILGQMIGINTAIHREAQNIGFAIPVSRIETVLARWLIPERFSDTTLGIIPSPMEDKGSFKIAEVMPGSPAEKAGLKAGMTISYVNGKKIKNLIELGRILWRMRDKEKIELTDNSGKKWTITAEKLDLKDGKTLAKIRLDLGLAELDLALAKSLDYPFSGGLVVTEPPKDNPEIRRGSVLVRLNDTAINSFNDISRALQNARMGQKIKAVFIVILKQSGRIYLVKEETVLEVK